MNKRKTWQLLQGLAEAEQQHFLRWLAAELEERQYYLQRLARWLIDQQGQAPGMQATWQQLYLEKPYDDARLRKLLRDLAGYLEEFMAIQALRQDRYTMDLYLLMAMEERQLPALFLKQLRKLERDQQQRQPQDGEYHRFQYQLEVQKQRYEAKYVPRTGRVYHPRSTLDTLDAWWMLERMELMLGETFNRWVGQEEQALLPEEAVLALIGKRRAAQSPYLVNLYEDLLYLLSQRASLPPPERQTLMAQIEERVDALPERQAGNLLRSLINYFLLEAHRQEAGEARSNIAQICLDLFVLAILKGYLVIDGVLSWNTLRSVVNVALLIPDYLRAEQLLRELLEFLPAQEREEAQLINQANIDFAQQRYAEIIRQLATRHFSKPLYEIQARTTLLLCHYELQPEEQEWLLSQIDNNLRFVPGQPVTPTIRDAALNFLRFFRRLVKAYKRSQLEKLREDIAHTRPLNRAQWLASAVERRLQERNLA